MLWCNITKTNCGFCWRLYYCRTASLQVANKCSRPIVKLWASRIGSISKGRTKSPACWRLLPQRRCLLLIVLRCASKSHLLVIAWTVRMWQKSRWLCRMSCRDKYFRAVVAKCHLAMDRSGCGRTREQKGVQQTAWFGAKLITVCRGIKRRPIRLFPVPATIASQKT